MAEVAKINGYFLKDMIAREQIAHKVSCEPGKGLSSNDFTDEDKEKINSIPTKTSDLANDSQFVNLAMLNEAQNYKVDKVEGKGLSSNDYTDEDKGKINSIDKKQDILVSGENIKTINNKSLLGEGNITIVPKVVSAQDENIPCFRGGYIVDSGMNIYDILTEHQDISGKEDISNKVTSISSTSTDTEYPSAKCVYDLIGDLETLLGGI